MTRRRTAAGVFMDAIGWGNSDRSYRCRECSGELDVVDTGLKVIVDVHRCEDWKCPRCAGYMTRGRSLCVLCEDDALRDYEL